MRILSRPAPPLPQPPPKVSVLVPAKDEAHQIESCLDSILKQDYPNFELIVIDDRSTDGTGKILDQLAMEHSRLRVVHLHEGSLPSGWGGKSFALHSGLSIATGEWLLFVDADVQLEPDVLSATIAWASKREVGAISLLPTFKSGGFWEGLLQPLAGAATSGMFQIPLTNSPEWPNVAFANGQYFCVRRRDYESVGGHEAVRGMLSEDVALARKLKRAGARPKLGWGESWASVRMYDSFAAVFRGWSRNFYVGSLGRPARILGLLAFIFICCYSILPALAWGIYRNETPVNALGGWGWIGSAIAHYIAMTAAVALMYRWSDEPIIYALLFPFSLAAFVAICARSLWFCITGKVEWRGTQYSKRELQTTSMTETVHGAQ